MEKKISSAVIKRLPRYYRYLSELLDEGMDRISSQELSVKMNVTASQIRQDFNNFGGFGQQGYGYNVGYLHAGFSKRGFLVSAIFDVSPEKIGSHVGNVEIYDMASLGKYVLDHKVDIAALTLPKSKAPEVAADLAEMGVRAFWNFAATDLNLPENVVIENVHLAESLMRLSYNITNQPSE